MTSITCFPVIKGKEEEDDEERGGRGGEERVSWLVLSAQRGKSKKVLHEGGHYTPDYYLLSSKNNGFSANTQANEEANSPDYNCKIETKYSASEVIVTIHCYELFSLGLHFFVFCSQTFCHWLIHTPKHLHSPTCIYYTHNCLSCG